jgi:hypothetical protein
MRVSVFEPEFKGFAGHTHQEVLGWIDACARASIELSVFAHRDIRPAAARETGAAPCFGPTEDDLAHFGVAHVLTQGQADIAYSLSTFLIRSRAFARDCAAAWARLAPGADLVILPWADASLLNGVADWLTSLRPDQRPALVAMLIMPEEGWEVDRQTVSANGEFSFLRLAARRLHGLCGSRFWMTCVDPRLAAIVGAATGLSCAHAPLPQYYGDFGDLPFPTQGVTLGLLGMPRIEKGGPSWGTLLLQIADRRPEVSFNLHVRDRSEADSLQRMFASRGDGRSLTLSPAPISRADYLTSIQACDLMLMPYNAKRYAMRASGVFADALAAGRPVVAPNNTWLSDRLSEGWGAGEIFDDGGDPPFISALERALDRLADLKVTAAERAPAWREAQSVEAFLEQILRWLATTR